MKFLVLALFVAAAVAAPVPDDNSDAVELIVNGVPEGTPLELGGVVDMHLNEHVNGQLAASTNLLHPYTAVGIAEAALAAAEIAPTPVQVAEGAPLPVQVVEKPESDFHITPDIVLTPDVAPIVLPTPVLPESAPLPGPLPAPIVLPSPELPEASVIPDPLPAPIAMPSPVAPEVVESIEMPAPLPPMVIEQPEIIVPAPIAVPEIPEAAPEPAAQGPNEIFNNGVVQVQVNAPEDAGMFSTLQNWFSLVVNYISNGIQTSEQIV